MPGNVEVFPRRRQTGLGHGMVATLAGTGCSTPEITGKLPGVLSPSMGITFADVPCGLVALSAASKGDVCESCYSNAFAVPLAFTWRMIVPGGWCFGAPL